MAEKLKKIDRTLLELLTGILISSIFCQAVMLLLPIDPIKSAVGLWMGVLIAFLSAIHMWRSLNKAFSYGEKQAARLLAGSYLVRYLIVAALLICLFLTNIGYVLTGFLGVMTLKVSAFLQPVTHKFYNKFFTETDS